jgi:hypothetical protein
MGTLIVAGVVNVFENPGALIWHFAGSRALLGPALNDNALNFVS